MNDDFEENFTKHLDVIKKHLCYPAEFGPKKNPKAKTTKKKKGTTGLVIRDTEQETVDHVILGIIHEVVDVLAASDSNITAGTHEAGHTNSTVVEIVLQGPSNKTTTKKKTKEKKIAKENEALKIQELLLSISKLN